jgi:Na+/H+-translocating membrane pyrophosphatase
VKIGKEIAQHQASIIGDTVGDPLKDTSGPSLNILVKIMAILSLVFGGFFERTQILAPLISR